MKNQTGTLPQMTITAPAGGLTSGQTYLSNNAVGVPAETVAVGIETAFYFGGRFNLVKKTGETWAPGEKVYWDDTNEVWTKTSASGLYDCGAVAAETVGSTTLDGDVWLPGVAAVAVP